MKKKELLGLFPQELAEELRPLGLPAFRSAQIFQWLHRGAGFADMTNLPKALRTQLKESFVDQPVSILEKRVSKLDGTVKMLYALRDGNCVEGVLMRYHYGYTLCLSTQVGCRMGCAFCASTLGGCVRSLSAAEMLGQIHCANTLAEEHVSNLVLMGSGEPFDNYDEVGVFTKGYRVLSKIPRVPANIVENLVRSFKSFQHILTADTDSLDDVEGIGEVRARTIKQSLRRMQDQFIFDNLI